MNKRNCLIVNEQPQSPIAEVYRVLRTNLQHSKANHELKTILITSSNPGEGRSVTAANTAIILAQAGVRVILIDGDLRKPVQHLNFGRIATGVTNVLMGQGPVEDYIQQTDIPNLKFLASGPLLPNPAELLGSQRMTDMLSQLRYQADYIIIDSPPVLPVTDTRVLASKVDGIILVLGAGVVHPEEALQAKAALERVHGFLLGVIINRISSNESIEGYSAYYRYA